MSENKISFGEAFPGLSVVPLPDGDADRIESFFILVKAKDAEGNTSWYSRQSAEINYPEYIGALISYVDALRRVEADGWDIGVNGEGDPRQA